MQPIKIFELCNPVYSGQLFEVDSLHHQLPSRLSVYEKEDGKAYIGRMNSGIMASMVGGITEEVMTNAFVDIEKALEYFIVD